MKRIFTFLVFLVLFKSGWAQSITEELLPQYVQGISGTSTAKVPYACRLKITGLMPGATYKYYNRFWDPSDATIAGFYLIAKESGFTRATLPSFVTSGRYGEFTTDTQGTYTGWFVCEASTALMFTPGTQLQVIIRLNDGAGGTSVAHELTTSNTVTVIDFGTDPGSGTALWSKASGGTAMNFVMLFDNEAGTGRPVAGTLIEDAGASADLSVANGYAPFYADNVNGVDKAWGTIIPNNLAGGIKKIVQYGLTTGAVVGSNTSTDGKWLSVNDEMVSTANTTGGSDAPIVLDGYQTALYGARHPQTLSFASPVPSEIAIGDAGFALSVDASSGLTDFVYTVSPSGILSITDNTVTGIAVGTATIKVRQLGNADYEPASTITSQITVKKKQNITFADIPARTYGDDVFALDVSSDHAAMPVTVASSNPSIAEVFFEALENRWKVKINGAGDVDLTASQASDAEYQAASVTKSFSIHKKALTITADNKTREVNTANPALTAMYTGFVAGEDEADLVSPVVLSTTADQNSPVGEYIITVSGAASPNYDITFEDGTLFVVNKLQLITFPAISNKIYGAEVFNPGATSNTGAAPVYTSSNTTVAVIENNEVQIKGVGQVRITATFPAVADYAATISERTFTVSKKPLTITAADKTKTYGKDNPQFTVQYAGFVYGETADALPVKPVLLTDAGKTSAIGSHTITVSGAVSVNYDITYEYGTLLIERAPLRIRAENKTKVQGEPNPPLTASYDGFVNGETTAVLATLPTLYTTVELSSAVGEYPITVSGAAASNYAIVYEDGIFAVRQKTRTLTFNPLEARTYGDADFEPGAILSSGEPFEYKSSNTSVATIINGKIHIVAAGVTDITAIAPANSNYENNPVVTNRLVVNRAPQFITFNPVPDLREGAPYEFSASTTSSLPIEFIIEDVRIVSVETNQLIPHRAGITHITATQSGDTNYLPAEAFTQRIQVTDTEGNLIAVHQALSVNGDGVNETLVIDGIENYQENHLVVVNRNGVKVFEVDDYNNEHNAFQGKGNTNYYGELPQGTYFYVLEFKANHETKRKTGYFILKY